MPSASYFAPGSVMTSIDFTELAGRLRSTSFGLLLMSVFGLPFTCTLKFDEPFTWILSSASTVTSGTLRSISSVVLVFESGSSSMLYEILSISAFTNGFCATTSTPSSTSLSSEV